MMTLEYLSKFMQTWNVWNLDNRAKAKPGIVNMLTILHQLITLLTIVMILMMIVIIIKQSPQVYNKDDFGGRSLCDYSACKTDAQGSLLFSKFQFFIKPDLRGLSFFIGWLYAVFHKMQVVFYKKCAFYVFQIFMKDNQCFFQMWSQIQQNTDRHIDLMCSLNF